MTTAFPLAWPAGWPRTRLPQRSNFKTKSLAYERDDLFAELWRLKAKNIILSTNLELRKDGLPYSGRKIPDDTGVAVYFILNGNQQCIPCDRWNSVEQNMKAITKSIDAIRGLSRWGAKEIVDAAFMGFKALPAGSSSSAEDWTEILKVSADASPEKIRTNYLQLIKHAHPDNGGTSEEFHRIQRAYEEATK